MAAGFRIEWRGEQLLQATAEACRLGINAVLADAARRAQEPGYAPRDTGTMANNIQPVWARREGTRTIGAFGNREQNYTLWQEVGFNVKVAVRDSEGNVVGHEWKFVPGKHFLKRAAQETFPDLPNRIREFMR